jgi:hypothetical protein
MTPNILSQLAALKAMSMPELKARWGDLFDSDPPPFNRAHLERRLAYRVQELAFGGLKQSTQEQLQRLGEELDGGNPERRRIRMDGRPVVGTRLRREWKGVFYEAIVLRDGFEFEGRPYQSLSAIARAITGTRWNGWKFFGLENGRRRA